MARNMACIYACTWRWTYPICGFDNSVRLALPSLEWKTRVRERCWARLRCQWSSVSRLSSADEAVDCRRRVVQVPQQSLRACEVVARPVVARDRSDGRLSYMATD